MVERNKPDKDITMEFKNIILQGDALEWLKKIPDKYCDVFTDPPYNIGKNYGCSNDDREDYEEWMSSVLIECDRIANAFTVYVPKKWNLLYWNVLGQNYQEIILPFTPSGAIRSGFSNQFNKLLTNARPQGKPIQNVWNNMAQPGMGYFFHENTHDHPGYTSEAITNRVIAQLCTSNIICDPFMGTGTTAVASSKLQKDYLGIELNPDYIKLAEKRLAGISEHLFSGNSSA
jgi:site-specific DNA-methyltransferase (adenine-specific)